MKSKSFSFFPVLLSLAITITGTVLLSGCQDMPNGTEKIDYRKEMRSFVEGIAEYARITDPDFIVIPQNGAELVSSTGESSGPVSEDYVNTIDGMGQEDLFYGYLQDDIPTPSETTQWIGSFLDLAKDSADVKILVTDYCRTHSKMDDSYAKNNERGYISFAAGRRELDDIPDYPTVPYNSNASDVHSLSEARNFLYLINPEGYGTADQFVAELENTNYDLIIMDLFFEGIALSPDQISALKKKANGGKRLLIAYMSIGEAEDYRYYWHKEWVTNPPSWLKEENPDWPGNYKVEYWNREWQDIIYGNSDSYLKKILDAGFDGVYLDIIDAFEYFEE